MESKAVAVEKKETQATSEKKEMRASAARQVEKKDLIFGKWAADSVRVGDISLVKYIDLTPKRVPHTFGKHAGERFAKTKINIVERLVNKIMRSGQGRRRLSGKYIRGRKSCGKKLQALKIVEKAFEVVEREAKENPIQVFVRAIEQSAPREDTTRLTRGGVSYTQAVDVAPMKRVDESIKNLAIAAFAQSFNTSTSAEDALAKEILLAAKEDPQSFSIRRRDEVERIAKSSR